MISVQNRLPEPGKENRVKITQDSGSPIEGVLAYADNASQQGTFWNRKTAQLLQGDIRTYPVRAGQSISAGDVVNVGAESDGQPETVYKDVVAQDNVENVLVTDSTINGTSVCKLSDTESLVAFSFSGKLSVFCIDNENLSKIASKVITTQNATYPCLSKLNENKFFCQYIYSNTLHAMVCQVSQSSITLSTEYTVASSVSNNADVIALSDILALSIYNASGLKCKVLPISGTTITTSGTVYSLPNNTGANHISTCRLPDEEGNKRVCICFSDTGDGKKGKAVIATIDSSNVVTFGSIKTFENSAVSSISCATDENSILVNTSDSLILLDMSLNVLSGETSTSGAITNVSANTYAFLGTNNNACVVKTSGSAVSKGDNYAVNGGSNTKYPSIASTGGNNVIAAYSDAGNSNYGKTTVLEISGNQIAGSFLYNSKDAIALADGTGGQSIPVGFGGYCECPGVTEGETIDSSGVRAFSPLDGWLKIYEDFSNVFVGSYLGDGADTRKINIGFRPKFILVFSVTSSTNYVVMCGCVDVSFDNTGFSSFMFRDRGSYSGNTSIISLNDNGFVLGGTGTEITATANLSGKYYKYIAWR